MKQYNRLNPLHWLLALFSNSRKSTYLHEGTLHVVRSEYKATQRIMYWLRNPAHDFTHYIIGFQDDPAFGTWLAWRPQNDGRRGVSLALRHWHWLPLPYIYIGTRWVAAYAGWGGGGKLGFKLRRAPEHLR